MPRSDEKERKEQTLLRVKRIGEIRKSCARIEELLLISLEKLRTEEARLDAENPHWRLDSLVEPKRRRTKPATIPAVVPADEDYQFMELVRLWRLDHPEPSKRRQIPKGKTQHEMDPDSD